MIKIYICDDDLDFLCKIKYQINDCISKGKFGDFEYEITDISNPVSALQKIKTETPDITFLDIDLTLCYTTTRMLILIIHEQRAFQYDIEYSIFFVQLLP